MPLPTGVLEEKFVRLIIIDERGDIDMDFGQGLMHGFSIALQPIYIYYALIGSIMGTITGVLPGLGPLEPWRYCIIHS